MILYYIIKLNVSSLIYSMQDMSLLWILFFFKEPIIFFSAANCKLTSKLFQPNLILPALPNSRPPKKPNNEIVKAALKTEFLRFTSEGCEFHLKYFYYGR